MDRWAFLPPAPIAIIKEGKVNELWRPISTEYTYPTERKPVINPFCKCPFPKR